MNPNLCDKCQAELHAPHELKLERDKADTRRQHEYHWDCPACGVVNVRIAVFGYSKEDK